jgi:hypothetical protein
MTGSQTATIVSVEELMEPQVLLPVGVKVKHVMAPIDGASPIVRSHEEVL